MTIRVVLAEDNALLREGLRGLIRSADDIELVATCADLPSCSRPIDEHRPDVVLTDIRMPPGRTDEGVQAAGTAGAHHPEDGSRAAQPVRRPGVRPRAADAGHGRPGLPAEGAGRRRRRAGRGAPHRRRWRLGDGPEGRRGAWSGARSRRATPTWAGSAPASWRCSAEMAQGHNNGASPASLFITQRAVEKHINSIFAKLGVGCDDDAHPTGPRRAALPVGRLDVSGPGAVSAAQHADRRRPAARSGRGREGAGSGDALRVVGEAADGEEAVELARPLRPGRHPDGRPAPRIDGIEATRRILAAAPGHRVVLISTQRRRLPPISGLRSRRLRAQGELDPIALARLLDGAAG